MSEKDPNQYRIPYRINEPRTLIFYPVHHIYPLAGLIFLGILTGHFLSLSALGFGWFFMIRRIEAKFPKGYLLSRMYWSGWAIFMKQSQSFPDPLKRDYYQ
ncbi:type IV conjugative transfer system protein TraL [Aliidiomarina quisquiliarum]|uniref:type IV conjugative transfer system protein TraL n=1 Tax=Aliidiomarina quisquiliarum TaxID=2938947 RepID=UPI00208E3835|nr:type IV conjugative transfer system protein TraL [Aliidiomarina quisquiliarum]MCO4319907.1 type IV conjugative transfer system protein TraL [Aliidiomarina quisquiliarum]